MYPEKIVLFTLNGKPIGFYMYGLLIGIGVALCFVVLWLYSKYWKLDQRTVDFTTYGAIAAVAIGFFSAMLFQAIYDYIDDPSAGFSLKTAGLTFIGGLIGGCASYALIYFIFKKKLKLHFIDISSIIPCCILLAHGFGRFGCFCAGCCYGLPTDSAWGVVFPQLGYAVYPTQLFEAVFLIVMFGICSFLYLKFKFEYNFSVYLISYGIFRFLIEFIRDDFRGGFVPGMSPSQFWSLVMIVLGVASIFLLRIWVRRRKVQLALNPVKPEEKKKKELKIA